MEIQIESRTPGSWIHNQNESNGMIYGAAIATIHNYITVPFALGGSTNFQLGNFHYIRPSSFR